LSAFLLVCVLTPALYAQQPDPSGPSAFPALDWLRDYLAEFSTVVFPEAGGGTREVVTTRTQGLISANAFVLAYERIAYTKGNPARIDGRQLIMYNVRPASLDPGSVSIQRQGTPALGDEPAFWTVTVAVREDPGFIPYDNLFESHQEDGAPDLTRSRGRVREIALGYFLREDLATGLATRFREFLASLPPNASPEAAPPAQRPAVKRPAQSDA
jgi:hypothetical protein